MYLGTTSKMARPGETLKLRWNEYESNFSNAFSSLKEEKNFSDVTLVCEEQQVEAHKVILSACSPFFERILKKNPHPHPLLYLKDVKFTDLESILQFMYLGEVNILSSNLSAFLAVAQDLEVKGLINKDPRHPPTAAPPNIFQPPPNIHQTLPTAQHQSPPPVHHRALPPARAFPLPKPPTQAGSAAM